MRHLFYKLYRRLMNLYLAHLGYTSSWPSVLRDLFYVGAVDLNSSPLTRTERTLSTAKPPATE